MQRLLVMGPSGDTDLGLAEIITLEQQSCTIGLGAGIGRTVTHVERGRVPPLAELSAGLRRQVIFPLSEANDLQPE